PKRAVELLTVDTEAVLQLAPNTLDQRLARVRDPAGGGGTMYAVECRDAVDPEPIEHLVAQQVAVARSERRERGAEGGLELAGGLDSEHGDVWMARPGRDREIFDRGFSAVLAECGHGGAARRHAEPGRQRAAAVVFGDLRRMVCVADEKPHAHDLHDI